MPACGFGKPRGVAADGVACSMITVSEVEILDFIAGERDGNVAVALVFVHDDADQNSQPR